MLSKYSFSKNVFLVRELMQIVRSAYNVFLSDDSSQDQTIYHARVTYTHFIFRNCLYTHARTRSQANISLCYPGIRRNLRYRLVQTYSGPLPHPPKTGLLFSVNFPHPLASGTSNMSSFSKCVADRTVAVLDSTKRQENTCLRARIPNTLTR